MEFSTPRKSRLWIPEAPHLLLRRTFEGVINPPGPRVAGFFRAELVRRGIVVFDSGWHKNLITDAGLLFWATNPNNNFFSYMAVGTGNSEPNVSQTTLDAEVARTNSSGGISDQGMVWGPGNEYAFARRTRTFVEHQANTNLTEWGWFSASSGGTMTVRQLFRDAFGNAIPITKTDEDQLRITYEFRVYPPQPIMAEEEIMIDGFQLVDAVSVPQGIGNTSFGNSAYWRYLVDFSSTVGFHSGVSTGVPRGFESNTDPSGTAENPSSVNVLAHDGSSPFREHLYTWNPGAGNFTSGFGGVQLGGGSTAGGAQRIVIGFCGFTPKIPKDDTKRLRLTARYSWDRYEEP